MIRKILTYYAERLEEYLSRFHRRPEGLATVGMIGNSAEERPNKMVVSLLNVERETAGGITAPVQRTADGVEASQPPCSAPPTEGMPACNRPCCSTST